MSKRMKIKTHLGYGTAYEKALLFDYAKDWVSKYDIKNVLEYPVNNLMGDNNEIFENLLGKENCEKLGENETPEKMYDLVWCFCEFEKHEDSQKFIQSISDRSRYVLIITQNYKNLGVLIHRIWHILWRRKWNHGIISKSSGSSVKKHIKDNYEIVDIGAFDCPWFYFDIYETLSDIKKILKKEEQKEQEFIITKSLFEKLPFLVRNVLCHHNYLIIKNMNCDLFSR